MTAQEMPDRATAAYAYALEQVYEIGRGMFAAYQIDTADSLEVTIKPWSELDSVDRLLMSRLIGPLLSQVGQAALAIGGDK